MKISKLDIKNVLRIQEFSHAPSNNVIVLGGNNMQGKSSILNCIHALAGKRAMSDEMLRQGAKKGHIEIVLDGDENPLTVRIDFHKSSPSKLTITNAGGVELKRPQEILSTLYSRFAFEPDEFSRITAKEQVDVLRVLDPSLDFAELNEERKDLFSTRTGVRARAKDAQGALMGKVEETGGPKSHDYTPPEPVNVAELVATLAEMEQQVRVNDEIKRAAKDKEDEVVRARAHFEESKKALAIEEEDGKRLAEESRALSKEWGDLTYPDIASVQTQLATAEAVNKEIRDHEELHRLQEVERELSEDAERLTDMLSAIDELKVTAIEKSNLGIPGLGLDDDTVTLNGLPFAQASDAERAAVCAEIGKRQNPELKVILIRNGSLFDEKSLAELRAKADADEYQYWIERVLVGKGEECTLIIEDGMIKNDDDQDEANHNNEKFREGNLAERRGKE